MHGIYIAFRAITGGSGYGIFPEAELVQVSGLAAFYGLILLIFFLLLVALSINFLIENADQREANLAGIKRIR
jgi:hypothetical protein